MKEMLRALGFDEVAFQSIMSSTSYELDDQDIALIKTKLAMGVTRHRYGIHDLEDMYYVVDDLSALSSTKTIKNLKPKPQHHINNPHAGANL